MKEKMSRNSYNKDEGIADNSGDDSNDGSSNNEIKELNNNSGDNSIGNGSSVPSQWYGENLSSMIAENTWLLHHLSAKHKCSKDIYTYDKASYKIWTPK